jgi:hypothetical protein
VRHESSHSPRQNPSTTRYLLFFLLRILTFAAVRVETRVTSPGPAVVIVEVSASPRRTPTRGRLSTIGVHSPSAETGFSPTGVFVRYRSPFPDLEATRSSRPRESTDQAESEISATVSSVESENETDVERTPTPPPIRRNLPRTPPTPSSIRTSKRARDQSIPQSPPPSSSTPGGARNKANQRSTPKSTPAKKAPSAEPKPYADEPDDSISRCIIHFGYNGPRFTFEAPVNLYPGTVIPMPNELLVLEASRKKYYVVFVGQRVGIFITWYIVYNFQFNYVERLSGDLSKRSSKASQATPNARIRPGQMLFKPIWKHTTKASCWSGVAETVLSKPPSGLANCQLLANLPLPRKTNTSQTVNFGITRPSMMQMVILLVVDIVEYLNTVSIPPLSMSLFHDLRLATS